MVEKQERKPGGRFQGLDIEDDSLLVNEDDDLSEMVKTAAKKKEKKKKEDESAVETTVKDKRTSAVNDDIDDVNGTQIQKNDMLDAKDNGNFSEMNVASASASKKSKKKKKNKKDLDFDLDLDENAESEMVKPEPKLAQESESEKKTEPTPEESLLEDAGGSIKTAAQKRAEKKEREKKRKEAEKAKAKGKPKREEVKLDKNEDTVDRVQGEGAQAPSSASTDGHSVPVLEQPGVCIVKRRKFDGFA